MKVAATHPTGVGLLTLNDENAARILRRNHHRQGFVALTIEQDGEFYRVDMGRAHARSVEPGEKPR